MPNQKSDADRRTHQLHVRLTATDHAVLKVAATKAKLRGDVSVWARMNLLTSAEALGVTHESPEVLALLAVETAERATATAPVKAESVVEPSAKVVKGKRPKAAPPAPKGKTARTRG